MVDKHRIYHICHETLDHLNLIPSSSSANEILAYVYVVSGKGSLQLICLVTVGMIISLSLFSD